MKSHCQKLATFKMLIPVTFVVVLQLISVTARPTDHPDDNSAKTINSDYYALQALLGHKLAGSSQEKAKIVDLVLQLLSEIDLPTLCDIIANDINGSLKDNLQVPGKSSLQVQDHAVPERSFQKDSELGEFTRTITPTHDDDVGKEQSVEHEHVMLSTNFERSAPLTISSSINQDPGYIQELTNGEKALPISSIDTQNELIATQNTNNTSHQTGVKIKLEETSLSELLAVPLDTFHSASDFVDETETLLNNRGAQILPDTDLPYSGHGKHKTLSFHTRVSPAQSIRELKQMHLGSLDKPGDEASEVESGVNVDMEDVKKISFGSERPRAQLYAKSLLLGDWANDKNNFNIQDNRDYKEGNILGAINPHNNENGRRRLSPFGYTKLTDNRFEKLLEDIDSGSAVHENIVNGWKGWVHDKYRRRNVWSPMKDKGNQHENNLEENSFRSENSSQTTLEVGDLNVPSSSSENEQQTHNNELFGLGFESDLKVRKMLDIAKDKIVNVALSTSNVFKEQNKYNLETEDKEAVSGNINIGDDQLSTPFPPDSIAMFNNLREDPSSDVVPRIASNSQTSPTANPFYLLQDEQFVPSSGDIITQFGEKVVLVNKTTMENGEDSISTDDSTEQNSKQISTSIVDTRQFDEQAAKINNSTQNGERVFKSDVSTANYDERTVAANFVTNTLGQQYTKDEVNTTPPESARTNHFNVPSSTPVHEYVNDGVQENTPHEDDMELNSLITIVTPEDKNLILPESEDNEELIRPFTLPTQRDINSMLSVISRVTGDDSTNVRNESSETETRKLANQPAILSQRLHLFSNSNSQREPFVMSTHVKPNINISVPFYGIDESIDREPGENKDDTKFDIYLQREINDMYRFLDTIDPTDDTMGETRVIDSAATSHELQNIESIAKAKIFDTESIIPNESANKLGSSVPEQSKGNESTDINVTNNDGFHINDVSKQYQKNVQTITGLNRTPAITPDLWRKFLAGSNQNLNLIPEVTRDAGQWYSRDSSFNTEATQRDVQTIEAGKVAKDAERSHSSPINFLKTINYSSKQSDVDIPINNPVHFAESNIDFSINNPESTFSRAEIKHFSGSTSPESDAQALTEATAVMNISELMKDTNYLTSITDLAQFDVNKALGDGSINDTDMRALSRQLRRSLHAEVADQTSDINSVPAEVADQTSDITVAVSAEVADQTSDIAAAVPAGVADQTSDMNSVPAEVADQKSDMNSVPAEVADQTLGITAAVPAEVVDQTSDVITVPAEVADQTSDVITVPAEVADQKSDITVAVPAEVADQKSDITVAVPAEVADQKSDITVAVPAEVADLTSAITVAVPAEVADQMSDITAAVPAEVADQTSDTTAAVPAEVADQTSAITVAVPAEVVDQMSDITAAVPAEVADQTSDMNSVPAEVADQKSDMKSVLAEVADQTLGITAAVPAEVADQTSDVITVPTEVADQTSDVITGPAEVADQTSDITVAVPAEVADQTSDIAAAVPAEVADQTSDMNSVPAEVADQKSDMKSVLAEVADQTLGITAAVPAEVADQTSDVITVPAEVADQTSDVITGPAEVADQTSDITVAVPAEVADQTSDIAAAVPAEVPDQTSDMNSVPAEVADQKSDINSVPAEVADQTLGITAAVPAEVVDQMSDITAAVPAEVADQTSDVITVPAEVAYQTSDVITVPVEVADQKSDITVAFADNHDFAHRSSRLSQIGTENNIITSAGLGSPVKSIKQHLTAGQSNDLTVTLTDVSGQTDRLGSFGEPSFTDNGTRSESNKTANISNITDTSNSLNEPSAEQNFRIFDKDNFQINTLDFNETEKQMKDVRSLEMTHLNKFDLRAAKSNEFITSAVKENNGQATNQENVNITSVGSTVVNRQLVGDALLRPVSNSDVTLDRLQKVSSMVSLAKLNLSEVNLNLQNTLQRKYHNGNQIDDVNETMDSSHSNLNDNAVFEEIRLSTLRPETNDRNTFTILSEDQIPVVISYKNVPLNSVSPSKAAPSHEHITEQVTDSYYGNPSTVEEHHLELMVPSTGLSKDFDNSSHESEASAYNILDLSNNSTSGIVDESNKADQPSIYSILNLSHENNESTSIVLPKEHEASTFRHLNQFQYTNKTSTSSMLDLSNKSDTTSTSAIFNLSNQSDTTTSTYTIFGLSHTDEASTSIVMDQYTEGQVASTLSLLELLTKTEETSTLSILDVSSKSEDTSTSSILDLSSKSNDVSTSSIIDVSIKANIASTSSTLDLSSKSNDASTSSTLDLSSKFNDASTSSTLDSSSKSNDVSTSSTLDLSIKFNDASTSSTLDLSSKFNDASTLSTLDLSSKSNDASSKFNDASTSSTLDLSSKSNDASTSSTLDLSSKSNDASTSGILDLSSKSNDASTSGILDLSSKSNDASTSGILDLSSKSNDASTSGILDLSSKSNDASISSILDLSSKSNDASTSSILDESNIDDVTSTSSIFNVPTKSNNTSTTNIFELSNKADITSTSSVLDVSNNHHESTSTILNLSNKSGDSSSTSVFEPSQVNEISTSNISNLSKNIDNTSAFSTLDLSNKPNEASIFSIMEPSQKVNMTSTPRTLNIFQNEALLRIPESLSSPGDMAHSPKATSSHKSSGLSSTESNFRYQHFEVPNINSDVNPDHFLSSIYMNELGDSNVYDYGTNSPREKPEAIPYASELSDWLVDDQHQVQPTSLIHPWKAFNIALGKHKVRQHQNRNDGQVYDPELQLDSDSGLVSDKHEHQIKDYLWKARPWEKNENKFQFQKILGNEKVSESYGRLQNKEAKMSNNENHQRIFENKNHATKSKASKPLSVEYGANLFNQNDKDYDPDYLKRLALTEEPTRWFSVESTSRTLPHSQNLNNVDPSNVDPSNVDLFDYGNEDLSHNLKTKQLNVYPVEGFPTEELFAPFDYTKYKVLDKENGANPDYDNGKKELRSHKKSTTPNGLSDNHFEDNFGQTEMTNDNIDWTNLLAVKGPASVHGASSPNDYQCPDLFGYHGDPDNCQAFFVCSWGLAHRVTCPPGTLYNSKLAVCDWAVNVNCFNSQDKMLNNL